MAQRESSRRIRVGALSSLPEEIAIRPTAKLPRALHSALPATPNDLFVSSLRPGKTMVGSVGSDLTGQRLMDSESPSPNAMPTARAGQSSRRKIIAPAPSTYISLVLGVQEQRSVEMLRDKLQTTMNCVAAVAASREALEISIISCRCGSADSSMLKKHSLVMTLDANSSPSWTLGGLLSVAFASLSTLTPIATSLDPNICIFLARWEQPRTRTVSLCSLKMFTMSLVDSSVESVKRDTRSGTLSTSARCFLISLIP
mmetsp:Transcript_8178/g.14838  ORF Transcript_8178/g.14838 Transcript_8178/m.14838 type:complete len:257 (-) Transcript_8178:1118-1888(-)